MVHPPDVKADAQRAFEVLRTGGVAHLPADVGYFLSTGTSQGLEKTFKGKKRGTHKRHPTMGTPGLEKELHVMEPNQAEVVQTLTQDLGFATSCFAKYDENHPVIKGLDEERFEASTPNETIHMAISTEPFTDELMKLCHAENFLLQGSSVNPTGTD